MRSAATQISLWQAYRLRWKRRRLLWRSYRSRHQLTSEVDRTGQIRGADVLCFATVRNERVRLPYFLEHYRQLGVAQFLIVDNESDDGTFEFLRMQRDVSLWRTGDSYRASRFGLDWLTWLQMRYAHGHWSLMVDADELLIYGQYETRTLIDLTGWLDAQGQSVFGAHMLDLYPRSALGGQTYLAGENPLDVVHWFDASPYRAERQMPLGNLWVQGGVRERVFFADAPARSPTLNKIPLVKWSRRYAYVNSCHSILPRDLNHAYDGPGGEIPSGVLLHTKFLPEITEKSGVEKERAQHFNHPEHFVDYYDKITGAPVLWDENSVRYESWQQLEALGLMTSGNW